MKILWVSHFVPYPETGFGALQRSRNLLKGCGENNEVTLLALCRKNQMQSTDYLKDAEADLSKFCEEVILIPQEASFIPNSARSFVHSLLRRTPYSVEIFRDPVFLDRIKQILGMRSFDIIHADTLGLCEQALECTTTPIVLNHHNIESEMMSRRAAREGFGPKQQFLKHEAEALRRFESTYCNRFALNLVVSANDETALRGISPQSIVSVVENPVDLSYWTSSSRYESASEILFVGSLDWYPNADGIEWFCQEIWPLILKKKPDTRLNIVGRNEAHVSLQQRFSSPQLRFTGFVEDVRPFFDRARAFICPIREGGGTNLKIIDAFASRVPVVSTTFGARGLNVTDGSEISLADTPSAFAEKIFRLLDDTVLAQQMRENAYACVSQAYSAKVISNKLVSLYKSISSPHK